MIVHILNFIIFFIAYLGKCGHPYMTKQILKGHVMFQFRVLGWIWLFNIHISYSLQTIQDFRMNWVQYINSITMETQIKECSWEVLLKYESLLKCLWV